MTTAQVAFEDGPANYLERVKHCLLALGSTDPDADIAAMGPYVTNAEASGFSPGVTAATIYTSVHHMHPVAAVGVGVALPASGAAEEAAEETRLWKVEYVNTRRKPERVFVEAAGPDEALTKARADAQSRGSDIDNRHQVRTTPERKVRLVVSEEGKPAKMKLGIAGEETFKQARTTLAGRGMVLTKKDDEYRVNFREGGSEATAYYTTDLEDALATGEAMADQRERGELGGGPEFSGIRPRRSMLHEAPKRPDAEAKLYQDAIYRKLMARFYRAEPGSPASVKLDKDIARRREELMTDPSFREETPAGAETPLAAEECGCSDKHPEDTLPAVPMAAEDRLHHRHKRLRWHRREHEGDTVYFAEGNLGEYIVAHRTPDRRHGKLPYVLWLKGKPVSDRGFSTKAEAQDFARAYDEIVPHVAPEGTPVEVGADRRALINGAKIVDACLPWVRVTRDPQKFQGCVDAAKKIGPVDSERQVYDLLAPYMTGEDQEVFLVVLLDVKRNVRGVAEVARGQRSRVAVDTADILRPVIITGASNFFVAHNHPSGDPTPSRMDKSLTHAVAKATKAALPDVVFDGHVVIGAGAYADAGSGKVTKVK